MDLLGIWNCDGVLWCIVLCCSFTCQHQQKSTALLFVCSVDVIHHNFWRELKTMKSCYPLTKISKYMWNNLVMDRISWHPQWKHSNSIAWLLFEIPMLWQKIHTHKSPACKNDNFWRIIWCVSVFFFVRVDILMIYKWI